MLCTPDLGPAYAISIVETNLAQPATPDLGGDKASYFIRVAKAHERIHEGLDPLSIAVQSIAIDKDAADAILSAGRAVVGRTRYEKPKDFGRGSSHGARFEFQVDHFHGQTLSPEPGFAADLTRLCHDLVECVNMPPAIRANALAKCVETALKLKDDAERAPW